MPSAFAGEVLAFGPGGLHEALQSGNALRHSRAPERPPPIEEASDSLVDPVRIGSGFQLLNLPGAFRRVFAFTLGGGESNATFWLALNHKVLLTSFLRCVQGDAISQDWRWLALRCERRLNASMQVRTVKQNKLADTLGTEMWS